MDLKTLSNDPDLANGIPKTRRYRPTSKKICCDKIFAPLKNSFVFVLSANAYGEGGTALAPVEYATGYIWPLFCRRKISRHARKIHLVLFAPVVETVD
jgi:hypothetical protein